MVTAEGAFPKSGADPLYNSEINNFFRVAHIESQSVGDVGSIIFSGTTLPNIIGSYNHIKLLYDCIGSGAALTALNLVLNNDTGSISYTWNAVKDTSIVENVSSGITLHNQFQKTDSATGEVIIPTIKRGASNHMALGFACGAHPNAETPLKGVYIGASSNLEQIEIISASKISGVFSIFGFRGFN